MHTARGGSTLVEVIVACVILAVIAIATASCLYLARGGTTVQRNRRSAMELANSRMEELRSAAYPSIAPPTLTYAVQYLDRIGGVWHASATDPNETVVIGGIARPMVTTVQYVDADGGSASYDCLRLKVVVQYRGNAGDVVILETIESP